MSKLKCAVFAPQRQLMVLEASESAEFGRRGDIRRVVGQLGYGVESVWSWVMRADIDEAPYGPTSTMSGLKPYPYVDERAHGT